MSNQNHEIIQAQEERIKELEGINKELREALVKIAKPDGVWSNDPNTYLRNCINNMMDIADKAIANATETKWDELELERRQGK